MRRSARRVSRKNVIPISSVQAYKFSSTATPQKPQFQAESVDDFLKKKYQRGCIFGRENLIESGEYKQAGWSFNFKPHMKKFVYKRYGRWAGAYAPSRTALRKSIYGKIDEIVERK